LRRLAQGQLINARPMYWLLRCSIRFVLKSGSSPVAFARTDNSGRPLDAMPPADSHCPTSLSLACARSSSVVTGCVCLHAYLVFKEPTAVRQWRSTRHPVRLAARPTVQVLPGRPRRLSVTARLGEPSEVTIPSHLCQHQNRESVLKKIQTVAYELKGTPELGTAVKPGRFPTGERSKSIAYRLRYVKSRGSRTADGRLCAAETRARRSHRRA